MNWKLFVATVLVVASAAPAATLINDGTSPGGLQALSVTNETGATMSLTNTPAGTLQAAQTGLVDGLVPLRTAWDALTHIPTSVVYQVAADFKPAFDPAAGADPRLVGGVMGWLDLGGLRGIAASVRAESLPYFQVSVVDFASA